jgi:hypothetical protein
MKSQRRFIKSITETAKAEDVQMPWARGARRDAMIARRKLLARALEKAPRKAA